LRMEPSGSIVTNDHVHLSHEDHARLHELRVQKPARNSRISSTTGAVVADRVAALVGSWRFIIIQSAVLGA